MTSSLDSRSLLYWIDGDPIFGITYTGKNDPDVREVCRETSREDAIFATLDEVVRPRQSIYLDTLELQSCLTARMRRDIEAILSSPHRSDCAAAMEAQRVLREAEDR